MYTNVSLTKLSRAFESWCSCAWFQAFSKANSLLSWIEESDGRDGAERENIVNRTQPAKVIFIALCLSRIANAESHNVCFDCQSQMQPWNLFPQWQVRAFLYGNRALAPVQRAAWRRHRNGDAQEEGQNQGGGKRRLRSLARRSVGTELSVHSTADSSTLSTGRSKICS